MGNIQVHTYVYTYPHTTLVPDIFRRRVWRKCVCVYTYNIHICTYVYNVCAYVYISVFLHFINVSYTRVPQCNSGFCSKCYTSISSPLIASFLWVAGTLWTWWSVSSCQVLPTPWSLVHACSHISPHLSTSVPRVFVELKFWSLSSMFPFDKT